MVSGVLLPRPRFGHIGFMISTTPFYDLPASRPVRVAILLGLHNGARFLGEQLDSIAGQNMPDWELIVSDDGAQDDGGLQTVRRFARTAAAHRVRLVRGPQAGAARNYLSLLGRAPEHATHAAFADQDDVWLPEKLARAVAALETVPAGRPGLYCSASWVCDAELGHRRRSRRLRRPAGFVHALVQNIAGGNTMVMNRAALTLAQAAAREVEAVASHDWWLYQIVSGAGGEVLYDPEPGLLYRQHDDNLLGANSGLSAALSRVSLVLKGRLRDWTDINVAALQASAHRLTEANRQRLRLFAQARQMPLPARLMALRRLGIYRQSPIDTAGLWVAAILNRL